MDQDKGGENGGQGGQRRKWVRQEVLGALYNIVKESDAVLEINCRRVQTEAEDAAKRLLQFFTRKMMMVCSPALAVQLVGGKSGSRKSFSAY